MAEENFCLDGQPFTRCHFGGQPQMSTRSKYKNKLDDPMGGLLYTFPRNQRLPPTHSLVFDD